MDLTKISLGTKSEFNVVIEVSMHSQPVKYEFDKESGAIFVDRFVATSMSYPCNYGFIPHTLSGDGDPVDVLVISDFPIINGAVIKARPVGVLVMEDEKGMDEKILAVPVKKLNSSYDGITSPDDLPKILLDKISHFFEHYKDLEKGKWVKIKSFCGKDVAEEMIETAIARASNK